MKAAPFSRRKNRTLPPNLNAKDAFAAFEKRDNFAQNKKVERSLEAANQLRTYFGVNSRSIKSSVKLIGVNGLLSNYLRNIHLFLHRDSISFNTFQ